MLPNKKIFFVRAKKHWAASLHRPLVLNTNEEVYLHYISNACCGFNLIHLANPKIIQLRLRV